MAQVRVWPWWRWVVVAGSFVVLGLDMVAFHLSGHADSRQHLRFYQLAHALTGLEIFVVLPWMRIATRRHHTRLAAEAEAVVDPEVPEP